MDPALSLAVVAGKVTAATIRRLGRGGGTTLPGRVSSRVDGHTLEKLSARLPRGSILVAGTNGKTTTATLLRTILRQAGVSIVANGAGSNMVGGLTAAVVAGSGVSGRVRAEAGVFEVDENSLPAAVAAISPRVVVVTNLFRDQLDRYGELDASSAAISSALAALPSASTALLCADDPRVAAMGEGLRARVVYYGLEDETVGDTEVPHAADARFCPRCGRPFDFARVYAGHLGHYRCPSGDMTRPDPQIRATEIRFNGLDSQRLRLSGLGFEDAAVEVPLSGLYNSYNIVAAAAAATMFGIEPSGVAPALRTFRPAFGRLERVDVEGRAVRLMLAKNPAGFNEVLRASRVLGGGRKFVVALNDRIADGRDVSWIWDVDFELLADAESIVVTGDRALDMRLRLKYAGLDPGRVTVAEAPGAALDAILVTSLPGDEVFVLPTYTAMLDLRAEMADRGYLEPYWLEGSKG
ncbi:MAG TPA: MurT ligase domain-containing protein [Candidatus Dormibacteraeota bacterium]|nr:MurT ligase domain-containing protein [Candidatus Dormibacteraeota bacterium]